jgi:hypothetical protein
VRIAARFALVAAIIVLATAFPAAVLASGPSCPDVISKEGLNPRSVSVGEQLTVTGIYTDWSNPGSVTARFEGPGGRRLTRESSNLPDGTYLINITFVPGDTGHWTVQMSVSEAAGSTTCRAAFDVLPAAVPSTSAALPSTSSLQSRTASPSPIMPAAVLASIASFGFAEIALRRRRASRPGSPQR